MSLWACTGLACALTGHPLALIFLSLLLKDRWASRRLEANELAPAILARLAELDVSGQ